MCTMLLHSHSQPNCSMCERKTHVAPARLVSPHVFTISVLWGIFPASSSVCVLL